MTAAPCAVRRWKRYGHDRLYVATPLGEPVGWLDLRTGGATIERCDLTDAFHAAVTAYLLAQQLPQPPDRPTVPAEEVPWTDLALNRPGCGVRAEAEALLAQMRAASRIRTLVSLARDDRTDERAFRLGAEGEEAVGPRLERLAKRGWRVLHAIPVGSRGSDIDHLLIGPGGVFCVNTKNRPHARVWVGEPAIQVNGYATHYLRNSRFEAQRVARALRVQLGHEVPVRAVLVFLTGTVVPRVSIAQMPDVLVLHRLNLNRTLRRTLAMLSTEQVERVYAVARRSSTWA